MGPLTSILANLAFVAAAVQAPAIAQHAMAEPIKSTPPTYPAQCAKRAEEIEFVTVRFDVSGGGDTENIIVMDSTNECFEKAAVKSIEAWRYNPETVDGQGVKRKGLEQTIHFQTE